MIHLKSFRGATAAALGTLGIFSLTWIAADARAQLPAQGEVGTRFPIDYDYYERGKDPKIESQVNIVESWHLSHRAVNKETGVLEYQEGMVIYCLDFIPNHPKALFILGELAREKHTPNLAIPYFERAIRLYPQHAYTHAQYGNYLVSIGALNPGIEQLELALRLDPNLAAAKAWLQEAQDKQAGSATASSH